MIKIDKVGETFKIIGGIGFVYAVDFLGLSLSSPKRDKSCGVYFVYGLVDNKEYIKVPSNLIGFGRKFKIIKRVMDEIVEDEIEIDVPDGISLDRLHLYLQKLIKELEDREKEEDRKKTEQALIDFINSHQEYVAYQIREFNKTKEGKELLRTGEFKHNGKRLIILHNYLTTRLNNTVVVAIIRENDLYPNIRAGDLAGLIIGRGGKNIKEVKERYNLKKIFLS